MPSAPPPADIATWLSGPPSGNCADKRRPPVRGRGGFWVVPDSEMGAARQQVLKESLDATAPRLADFLSSGLLALDLTTDTMVDLYEEANQG